MRPRFELADVISRFGSELIARTKLTPQQLPHQLNAVCLHNQRMYYDLLFAAAWYTLRSFGYSHYGVETGAVAVLHTWGQNLSLHPHLHCIVPAAGYALDGGWKNIGALGKYLYPVHQLSAAFKGKFLDTSTSSVQAAMPVPGL